MEEQKQFKLASKLVSAMKSIGVVEKRGTNTKQDYKFVKAADVANEVRTALANAGVAFTYDIEEERTWEKTTNNGGTLFYCGLRIRGDFHDTETGEILSGRSIGWGADSLDKAPYKAMTGALKYLLRMNFLIPDEDDPEVDNTHYEKDNAPTQAPAKPVYERGRGPQAGRRVITQNQLKRLFAIGTGAKLSSEDVKLFVREEFGIEQVETITTDHYDAICNKLLNMQKAHTA